MKPVGPRRYAVTLETPLGAMPVEIGTLGIYRLKFAPVEEQPALMDTGAGVKLRKGEAKPQGVLTAHLDALLEWLRDYFRGKPPQQLPLIDWSGLGNFESNIVKKCAAIPFGTTISYGELARQAGNAQAARAVGGAMGRNRHVLLVPCHRVLAAAARVGGPLRLGGFGGGLALKQWLLRFELEPRDVLFR